MSASIVSCHLPPSPLSHRPTGSPLRLGPSCTPPLTGDRRVKKRFPQRTVVPAGLSSLPVHILRTYIRTYIHRSAGHSALSVRLRRPFSSLLIIVRRCPSFNVQGWFPKSMEVEGMGTRLASRFRSSLNPGPCAQNGLQRRMWRIRTPLVPTGSRGGKGHFATLELP